MFTILCAVLLPWLYWDQGQATADAVRQNGIERLLVPAGQEKAWKNLGFDAQPFDAGKFTKVPAPGVRYQMDAASATSVPWVDANGWRFERDAVRNGKREYYYDVPWRRATLAAAEAHAYGVSTAIHTEPRDLADFGRIIKFLREIDRPELPPLANIGIADDGSAQTGEVLNLLARRNLLFRVVPGTDAKYDLNIRIGTEEYPKAKTADPAAFAALVRQKLTDEKRLLRLFGSDVVLGRLTGDGTQARLHLINYGGGKVEGLRVRVRGAYAHHTVAVFNVNNPALADYNVAEDATEFTISEMDVYAVIDLRK